METNKTVKTRKKIEAVDVTSAVEDSLKGEKGEGLAFVFTPHCTCGLFVNEFEPNIAADYEELFGLLEERNWRHNEIDDNASAHLASAVAGSSVLLPVRNGRLELGTWQRVILMEFDGPRQRKLFIRFLKTE